MRYLDWTLPEPEQNLACDEALLDLAEDETGEEVLRTWEAQSTFVVLGYSNIAHREVHLDFCQAHGIPVLRRCTGGGAVLQSTGCLNYTLILKIEDSGPLRSITETNCFIMQRSRDALQPLTSLPISVRGHTDLTLGDLKFSGNAQRRKRRFLIFHGTFLLEINSEVMEKTLTQPTKEPAYRQNRSHRDFLREFKAEPSSIKMALKNAWHANEAFHDLPFSRVDSLVQGKYSRPEWNLRIQY